MDKTNKIVIFGLGVIVLLVAVGFLANSYSKPVIKLATEKWQISGIVVLVLLLIANNSGIFNKKSTQTSAENAEEEQTITDAEIDELDAEVDELIDRKRTEQGEGGTEEENPACQDCNSSDTTYVAEFEDTNNGNSCNLYQCMDCKGIFTEEA